MALAMAETLTCGTATAEAVAMTTSATLNDWRPDDTFFDLLGGKDVVQAMLADIASPTVAEGNKERNVQGTEGHHQGFLEGHQWPRTQDGLAATILPVPAQGLHRAGWRVCC